MTINSGTTEENKKTTISAEKNFLAIQSDSKNSFSWKRVGKIIGSVLLVAAIFTGLYLGLTSRPARIFYASIFLDNHEHYLTCYELPFYPQVTKAFEKHQKEIEQIKKLGAFDVESEKIECSGYEGGLKFIKGDLLIQYDTRDQRKAIEGLLGKDFFGIPYRGENH